MKNSESKRLEDLDVVIVGLGLMGGAYADAFRKIGVRSISAYDIDEEVLEKALSEGTIDQGYSDDTIRQALEAADLVIVSLYPQYTIEFIQTYKDCFKAGAIVSDICGVKQYILDKIEPLLPDTVHYISGHPMAGSEKEGYGGADRRIFNDRNYILIRGEHYSPASYAFFKQIIRALGFTNIVETDPVTHDSKIAFTSQLCHVIASALIDGEDDLKITDYEGGSFADLTRIAMINAPMWTELFIENSELLTKKIDGFIDSMIKIRNHVENHAYEPLEDTLSQVRSKRIKMEIDRINKHNT